MTKTNTEKNKQISFYKAFPLRLKAKPGFHAFFTLDHDELHYVNVLSFPSTLPAHPLKLVLPVHTVRHFRKKRIWDKNLGDIWRSVNLHEKGGSHRTTRNANNAVTFSSQIYIKKITVEKPPLKKKIISNY